MKTITVINKYVLFKQGEHSASLYYIRCTSSNRPKEFHWGYGGETTSGAVSLIGPPLPEPVVKKLEEEYQLSIKSPENLSYEEFQALPVSTFTEKVNAEYERYSSDEETNDQWFNGNIKWIMAEYAEYLYLNGISRL